MWLEWLWQQLPIVLLMYQYLLLGLLLEIQSHFPNVDLDEYIIMPNHIHGILNILENRRDTACRVHNKKEIFGQPAKGTIPSIIRSYKSAVTKGIKKRSKNPNQKIWQPRFYDHVIRNERDLSDIRVYIKNNPLHWELNNSNPDTV